MPWLAIAEVAELLLFNFQDYSRLDWFSLVTHLAAKDHTESLLQLIQ